MVELFMFVAILIEMLVEMTFGRVFGASKPGDPPKKWPGLGWALPYISILFGIGICFGFRIGAVAGLMLAFAGGESVVVVPLIDYVLTGILLAGGADVWHGFRTRVLPGGGR